MSLCAAEREKLRVATGEAVVSAETDGDGESLTSAVADKEVDEDTELLGVTDDDTRLETESVALALVDASADSLLVPLVVAACDKEMLPMGDREREAVPEPDRSLDGDGDVVAERDERPEDVTVCDTVISGDNETSEDTEGDADSDAEGESEHDCDPELESLKEFVALLLPVSVAHAVAVPERMLDRDLVILGLAERVEHIERVGDTMDERDGLAEATRVEDTAGDFDALKDTALETDDENELDGDALGLRDDDGDIESDTPTKTRPPVIGSCALRAVSRDQPATKGAAAACTDNIKQSIKEAKSIRLAIYIYS